MEITIPTSIYDYAAYTFKNFVPLNRKSGFSEIKGQPRGEGDFLDLVAKLTLFDMFGKNNKVCSMNLICGAGDDGDLTVFIGGKPTIWNIKTSKYAPFREGLNLFVKNEELNKKVNGYIQCFVHLGEGDLAPHMHVPGYCLCAGSTWNEIVSKPIIIPQTKHRGIGFPVEKLRPLGMLIRNADIKF